MGRITSLFGNVLVLSWTQTFKKEVVMHVGGEETVTVDTLELPKGGNSDELVSGNLICFSALAGLLAFMLEY